MKLLPFASPWYSRSVLDFYGGADVGHFDTIAEMSWVRSVLGPKCPYTVTD